MAKRLAVGVSALLLIAAPALASPRIIHVPEREPAVSAVRPHVKPKAQPQLRAPRIAPVAAARPDIKPEIKREAAAAQASVPAAAQTATRRPFSAPPRTMLTAPRAIHEGPSPIRPLPAWRNGEPVTAR